ncbi:MAG: hypothetical protein AB7G93_17885 [Bdellovibrionales bacterium]
MRNWVPHILAGIIVSTIGAMGAGAQARVFSYKDAFLSSYIRGTGQLSAVGKEPFGNSSGTDTSVDEETRFGYSGEIGFVFNLTQSFHLRLGAEAIQHRPVKEAKGLSPSGAERFSLDSSVFVFNPNVALEYVYSQRGNLRFYMTAGVGLAEVTVENRYTMTAAGTSQLGVEDFNEKLAGSTYSSHFGVGLETLFVDNVTFSFDVGYRYLPVPSLKYKGPTNPIVSPGGVNEGDEARTHGGGKRQLDLGGLTLSAAFRFYLNFL